MPCYSQEHMHACARIHSYVIGYLSKHQLQGLSLPPRTAYDFRIGTGLSVVHISCSFGATSGVQRHVKLTSCTPYAPRYKTSLFRHLLLPFPVPDDFDQDKVYDVGANSNKPDFGTATCVTATPDELEESTDSRDLENSRPQPHIVYRLKTRSQDTRG
jgi:hypothetical protein